MAAIQLRPQAKLKSKLSRSSYAPLPTKTDELGLRIRCKVDGKWERRGQFSKNQLKKWDQAKKRGTTAQLICLKHSAGTVMELRCETCGIVKNITHFSNAARKVNGSQDCRDCIDWYNSDQAGGTVLPPPNGQRNEWEYDLAQNAQDADEKEWNQKSGLDQYPLPANMLLIGRGKPQLLAAKALVEADVDEALGLSVASYGPSSAPSDDLSSVGTVPIRRSNNQERTVFRAVAPNGEVQWRTQSTINPSDTASIITDTTTRRVGNWAKVPTRKTNPDPPNYLLRETPETRIDPGYDSDASKDSC